tara:strand:+ start:138 stop:320 length:183 start_codon:yes stop_codon:yes gene_type:complete
VRIKLMLNSLKKFISTLFKDASELQKPLEIKETEVTIDTPKVESEPTVKQPMSSKKKKKR